MTTVMIHCKHNSEKKTMDFEIRLSQDDAVQNEEKSAALFLVPFIQDALTKAIKEAESRTNGELKDAGDVQPEEKIDLEKPLDGGPSIITLE